MLIRALTLMVALSLVSLPAVAAPVWTFTAETQAGPILQNDGVLFIVSLTVDPLSPEPFDFRDGLFFGYTTGVPQSILDNYRGIPGVNPIGYEQAHGITVAPGDTYTFAMTGWYAKPPVTPGLYGLDFFLTDFVNTTLTTRIEWTVESGLSDDPELLESLPEPSTTLLLSAAALAACLRSRSTRTTRRARLRG